MPTFDLLRHEADARSFRAGELIFSEGEPGEHMYAVLEGEVAIRKGERVLEVVGSGSVFGEMALIDRMPRSAAAIAKSDCRVAAVDQSRFMLLVQQTPFFALQMMQVLSDRLRRNTAS